MDTFIYGFVAGMIGMFCFLLVTDDYEYGAHWLRKGLVVQAP